MVHPRVSARIRTSTSGRRESPGVTAGATAISERSSRAPRPAVRGDVHAHFGGRVVCGSAAVERAEADPRDHFALDLRHPQRAARRVVRGEPDPPPLDRDRNEVGGRGAPGNGRIVDLDDRPRIGKGRESHDDGAVGGGHGGQRSDGRRNGSVTWGFVACGCRENTPDRAV